MQFRLDRSIRSRQIECSGLSMHVLECGEPRHEMILLLHGFPELAFSWRKVLPLLAHAGFYVVAPDLRGYGATVPIGTDPSVKSSLRHEDGISGFGMVDTLSELVGLVYALHGERGIDPPVVRCVVGHDMGSAIAANLALVRPDIFKALVMMSAPYTGPPSPVAAAQDEAATAKKDAVAAFSDLSPPRKHYQLHFCAPEAAQDWTACSQGLKSLYRGYYYFKSSHHPQNQPYSLGNLWDAKKMSRMPEYYIMRKDSTMSQTVSRHVPDHATMVREMTWMPEADLDVYAAEFERTGFQGGLNHYRARISGHDAQQLSTFIGRRIEVPTTFISGALDWGNYQDPGALEKMQSEQTMKKGQFKGVTFIADAGHWVQQEQPEKVVGAILAFLMQR